MQFAELNSHFCEFLASWAVSIPENQQVLYDNRDVFEQNLQVSDKAEQSAAASMDNVNVSLARVYTAIYINNSTLCGAVDREWLECLIDHVKNTDYTAGKVEWLKFIKTIIAPDSVNDRNCRIVLKLNDSLQFLDLEPCSFDLHNLPLSCAGG